MAKRLATWFSTLPLSLALVACAADMEELPVASDQAAILGGTKTTVGDYPTVVALIATPAQGQGQALCTGTLIAPTIVLTAAHCVQASGLGYQTQEQVAENMVVMIDSVVLQSGGGKQIGVKAAIPHSGFSQPGDPDVGIVKLKTAITDREPTPINLDAAKAPIGTTVTMVGFGVSDTQTQSAGTEFVLMNKTSVACSGFGTGAEAIADSMFLCFDQSNGSGKCQGDSGGPSFATIDGKQTVVGITSFGDQFCGQLGADMRVDAAKDFIIENAPELFCIDDNSCSNTCGAGGLPVDPDCGTCTETSDCATEQVCQAGNCVPGPGTPGGQGAECTDDTECLGNQECAAGPGGMKCTERCDPNASTCADGFDCLPAGTTGACWPSQEVIDRKDPSGCGCRVGSARSGAGAAGGGFALLLLVGAFVTRRRRRA